MKKCKYCGSLVEDNDKFCSSCGASEFNKICPNCGSEITGAYCPNCGTKANQKAKVCPECGTEYYSNACPNCGYVKGRREPEKIVEERMVYVEREPRYDRGPKISKKKRLIALILCYPFGVFGLHHFYVGRRSRGFLYLFTFGFFALGLFYDMFAIIFGQFEDEYGYKLKTWI